MARAVAEPKVRQSKPKCGKKRGSYVPGPQQQRIKQKYVTGQSIRQIAKEEHRNQPTVSKIVKSEDIEKFRVQMREQLWGLLPDAIGNIRRGPQQDPRLGLNVCKYVGIEPDAEQAEKKKELQGQVLTAEEHEVDYWVQEIVRAGIERHKIFGTPLRMMEGVVKKSQNGEPDQQE